MYPTEGSSNPIDLLLADAQILTGYDRAQAPTAAERVARARQRARRELDLTCARVLNDAPSQTWFDDAEDIGGESQLFFACLLHLIGNDEGAEFWWQFAAGSGLYTAAQCLALHCRCAGRPEASFWQAEADRLFAQQGEHAAQAASATSHRALADHIAEQLLEQCRRGVPPRFPAWLEERLNREGIEHTDTDFPRLREVVTPSHKLCGVLADA